MRKRQEIEADGSRKDILTLEVLLDIRELLKKKASKPMGRPRKSKKECV